LEVGSTSDTVTITDAPTLLNTETSARGEVTTKDEIAELPLDGRNFSDLALLTGGVIPVEKAVPAGSSPLAVVRWQ